MTVRHLFGIIFAALLAAFASMAGAEVLKVGTNAYFAPFEFVDEKNNIIGFDIDIIMAIAEESKFDVHLMNIPFDDLADRLEDGTIDIAISAMTIAPWRKDKVDFSEGYYGSALSAMIRKADAQFYTKPSELERQKLCAKAGTTGEVMAEKLSHGNVIKYPNHEEAFQALREGKCEAFINDRPVNLYYAAKNHLDDVQDLGVVLTAADYGIAVKKGNERVLKMINHGIDRIRNTGKYVEIHRKWFVQN